MRILYHHRTASRDGQAVHIEEMIGALRGLGHEVCVVAPEAGADAGEAMGAKVGWVHGLRDRLPKALYELLELGYSAVAYRRLMAAARAFKPDVLYERCNLFLISGVLVHRRLGLPMLLEVNAPLADERGRFGGLGLARLAQWSERFAWRGADRVLPVTRVLGDIVVAGGVADERIVVIPNGINEAHFAHAPAPAEARQRLGLGGGLVLGFTGFVRDWHGVDRVLRWMATPQAPEDCRLLVVGDGPARPGLEQLARELGLEQRLQITGFVSRDEVPGHVAAFDIALQPAVTSYASPLKLFEYLALGKAIVAPRSPNILEVLCDGANALLFEEGTQDSQPNSLAQALTRLAGDPALRQRLGAGARATIAEKGLTWEHNARRVSALFGDLLARRPNPQRRAHA
ncbi:MAG: glycosyltransferase family 4 protein [Burkholderiales bacterium]|nr:glycosyltransferase family 4 protein [Burkholderiales bacterium]